MQKFEIPVNMYAVRQHSAGDKLIIEQVPVTQPGTGEVLIKMEASPINPSDLSLLQGTYNTRPNYPFTPGLEGCGTVVAAGRGILPRLRLGHRVACSPMAHSDGTWAQYLVTKATRCIPLKNNIQPEQGAMLLVNPMTALAFIEIAKTEKHNAIVNNAAASTLGKMLIKLANIEKIEMINIVRKKEQVDQLQKIGAKHVLNSCSPNFLNEFKQLSLHLNATLFLDAIGGSQTAIYAEVSPKGSTILLYANLSEQPFTIQPRKILQEDKVIRGFSLGNHTASKSISELLQNTKKVQQLIGNELKSEISRQFNLQEINEAIQFYTENMSLGKVIIKP